MKKGLGWIGLAAAGAAVLLCGRWQQLGPRTQPLAVVQRAADGAAPASAVGAGRDAAVQRVSLTRDQRLRLAEQFGKVPVAFEPNVGQASREVKFLARGRGYGLYLTGQGAMISVASGQPGRNKVVRMHFESARPDARVEGQSLQDGHSNYFLGNNPARWYRDVPHFGRVAYTGIYDGIDLVYYGNQQELEYDVIVNKGADPNQVRIRFDGVSGLRIADGDLILVTPQGELRQRKPVIYQRVEGENVPIPGRYVIHGRDLVSFEVENYNRDLDLVIDPVLTYSSYLGGGATDFANAIAVDNQGSAYLAGGTDSSSFPGFTPQSFVRAGFVTKLSPAGDSIVYTTFIGGSSTNWAKAVAVDSNGNAYVTGLTTSADFPTSGPFQGSLGGARDGFVVRLSAEGNELVYSSYIGGSGDDFGAGIAVDSSFNAYITGTTLSADFPVVSPIQETYAGAGDAFVAKVNPLGSALAYSTFLGGASGESGERVAVDSTGAAYVTGGTSSTNFPTSNPIQAANAGGLDAFVTKLNPTGSAYAYSTYLGGAGPDSGLDIALDGAGSAHVAGYTQSVNFPVQSPQQGQNAGSVDAFVAKLNVAGSALSFSTYLGGGGDDYAYGVAVDSTGHVLVAGMSSSSNFPLVDPLAGERPAGREAFLTKYNPAGSALVTSFRYGGAGSDEAADVAVDSNANAYITGSTTSSDFPVTLTSFQPRSGGTYDGFVSKISTCSFTFDWVPGSAFEAQGSGSSWSVNVTAPAGCPWSASSAVPWVTVTSGTSGNGNGSAAFAIQPNPTGTVRNAQVNIAGTTFSIVQGSGPSLSTSSSGLFFYAYYGSTVSPQQFVVNYSSAAPGTFTAAAQTSPPGGNWLNVAPSSGSFTANQATLTVSINTASLSFAEWGVHQGSIVVQAPGATNTLTVPVTLYTYPAQIQTDPPLVAFAYRFDGAEPAPRTVTLQTGSSASVNFTTSSSAPFIQVSPASGTTVEGTAQLTVSANVSALQSGTHHATITITPAQGAPYQLPVKVVVGSTSVIAVEAEHVYFYYEAGTYPELAEQVQVRASGGEVPYFADTEIFDDVSNWLGVTPASGIAPGSSTIFAFPSGLAPGLYEGAVHYRVGESPPETVFVHLTIDGSLTATPESLQFSHRIGQPAPPAQELFGVLSAFGGSVFMEASASTSSGGSWLSVSPSSGFGESVQFLVSVNPSELAPGEYQGSVTISAPESGLLPVEVPVSFTVQPPALSAEPASVERTYTIGQGPSGTTVTQTVALTALGSNVSFTTGSSGGSWLTVSPFSGTTPATLTVTMNPEGLSPGLYSGTVTVNSSGAESPLTIPVSFTVQALSPLPAALTFGSFLGDQAPPPQLIQLPPLPSASSLTVTSAVTTPSGGAWLSAAAAPAGTNGVASVSVTVNPAGLPAGTYTGTVTITPNASPNNPVTVPVTYVIAPLPSLTVPPTPLNFAAVAGAANVPAQTVPVTSTGAHLEFRLAPTTAAGGNWLTAFAVRNGTTPSDVTVSVNAANLTAGNYTGNVIVWSPNDSTGAKIIPVNLAVSAAYAVAADPTSLSFTSIVGNAPPTRNLAIRITNQTSTYAATALVATPEGGSWLSVAPASGAIATTATNLTVSVNPAGLTPGTYTGSIRITVPGAGNTPFSIPVTYTVSANPLIITAPCPATTAVPGVFYSFAITATGGNLPLSWQLVNSTLPPGLTLNTSTGVISGTPAAAGTYPIRVRVSDTANGQTQTVEYVCNIVVVPTLTITNGCSGARGTVGQGYAFSLGVTGGTPPYQYVFSGQLPPGLTFNQSTGQITGTPTGFGSFDVSIRVTDSGVGALRQTQTFTCAILINSPRLRITSACPSTVQIGTFLSHPLAASGGDGVYRWTVSVGSLPAGLTILNDQIRGTPTGPPASVSFSLQVSSEEQSESQSCTVRVNAPPVQITSGCPGNGVQGQAFTPFPLSATGGSGAGTYAFSIVNGSLPAGLTLNDGIVSGTPQGPPGRSNFTIQASSGGQTNTLACSMNIAPTALELTGTCPVSATAGTAVSATVTASGGQAPYSFTFNGSPFLRFANGTVSGTPTTAGEAQFSVTVNDAANSTPKTFSCSFPVNSPAPPLEIGASCPTSARAGTPVNIPLAASGGNGDYSWNLSGPAWLSLSSSSGASVALTGTPPSVGFFDFSVTLTDSVNTAPARFACSLTVNPSLQMTSTGCPTGPIAFQSPVTLSFSAAGGTAPLQWSLSGPPFLSLSSASGPSTTVTGVASVAGSFTATVSVNDSSNGAPVTSTCALVVNPAVIPPITITGPAQPPAPPASAPVGISLGSNTPVPLRGRVRLTFTPNARNPIDNPQVHFSSPCLRDCTFEVAAGAQALPLPNVEVGTVAGTIRVEIVELLDGDRNVLPSPAPFRELVIPATRPVITSLTIENERADGFDLVISGYSSTREISSATLTFAARADSTIQGGSVTQDLTAVFDEFYRSGRSTAGGSMFEGLRIPINVSGDKEAIASVTVVLTNSVGASDPATRSR